MLELASRPLYFDCWMRPVLFEFSRAAANQAQLGIGIKTAVFNPAAKKEILAGDVEADHIRLTSGCAGFTGFFHLNYSLDCCEGIVLFEIISDSAMNGCVKLTGETWFEAFIRVQLQNPIS